MKYNSIQDFKKHLINEGHYQDQGSNGDYAHNQDQIKKAEDLYEQGQQLFNAGDIEGAENLRQQALKVGSWLDWDETELPAYVNKVAD